MLNLYLKFFEFVYSSHTRQRGKVEERNSLFRTDARVGFFKFVRLYSSDKRARASSHSLDSRRCSRVARFRFRKLYPVPKINGKIA